jgi:hypothetical protein
MDILSRLRPDRARNAARQPNLPSNPKPSRNNLKGAPTGPIQKKGGVMPPSSPPDTRAADTSKGGSYIPTAPAKKAAVNPNSMVDVPGVNNWNMFSNTPTKSITTRFEGE